MKAIFQYRYGPPGSLILEDTEVPVPKKGEVRVRIGAVSLNGSDFEFLSGHPGYVHFWGPVRPPRRILGSDIAGIVDAVGSGCNRFSPGDRVFGDILYTKGGLAEYVCAPENLMISLPDDISFETAAAIPQAGTVALQSIRNMGRLHSGERVLINGAGGGAGTFALQLALMSEAEVTVVDDARKLSTLKKMGAHHTIDYRTQDYTKSDTKYDLIVDFTCYRSTFDFRRILSLHGRYVLVGGAFIRILQTIAVGSILKTFGKQKFDLLAHRQNESDLLHMIELHRSQKVSPVISRLFPLTQTAEAFSHMMDGGVGKVVITP
jgi:NADPH:quinone reductase-like Zn-dependent oxidoreductase